MKILTIKSDGMVKFLFKLPHRMTKKDISGVRPSLCAY